MAGSIKLESSDGMVFEVDRSVALTLKRIEHIVEDEYAADSPISIPDVTGEILSKIIDYCRKHAGSEADDDDLEAFDANFVRVEESTLWGLSLAAYNLNIQSLCHLTYDAIARVLEGKTVAEIRKMFNMNEDLTAAEEEEIRTNLRLGLGIF